MQIRKNRFDTKRITLTASLAALYIIPRTIPLDKLIGISGSITFSGIITPVLGLFVVNPNSEIFVGASSSSLPVPFQWFRLPSPPIPYLWLHLVALAVLVSPQTRNLGDKFIFGARRELAKAVLVVAFVGTMLEHVTGGILFASIVGSGARFSWPLIFIVYPFERAVIVLGAILVCTPLLLASRDLMTRFHLHGVKQDSSPN